MPFCLAYSISSSLVVIHSRMGAMIFMLGSWETIPTSNLTWSFPLAVHPWAMNLAPSALATSTSFLAIRGLAMAVLRG